MKLHEKLGVFPPKWAYDQLVQSSNNVITGDPFEESLDDLTIWADFEDKLDILKLNNSEN
jgi:hypothetical protein